MYEESFLIYGMPAWVVRWSPGGLEVGSVAKSGFRVLVPGIRKFNSLHGHGDEEMKEQEVQCVGDSGRTFDRKLEIPSCFNSPLINKEEIPLGSEDSQEEPLRFMVAVEQRRSIERFTVAFLAPFLVHTLKRKRTLIYWRKKGRFEWASCVYLNVSWQFIGLC